MARRVITFDIAGIELTRSKSIPLFLQLCVSLRTAVLEGRLKTGTRLPSSRWLATQLGVSRLTVVDALEQLAAEGYVVARRGSGTFVADLRPPLGRPTRGVVVSIGAKPLASLGVSRRGAAVATLVSRHVSPDDPPEAFRLGVPALDTFPHTDWARASRSAYGRLRGDQLGYGGTVGYRPLREAIAASLGLTRGINCSPDQVMIVAGTQQALDLSMRVLTDPGDEVWVEDPGYLGTRGAILSAGCKVVPVAVDAQGLSIKQGPSHSAPRLVYVTPSHQFPLGMTMTLPRRMALIEWARRVSAVILEDDSSHEFRHTGRLLSAIRALDEDGRVLYIGTFSKVLFPALRLGYIVVPPSLTDAFAAARRFADWHSPVVAQATVAQFIEEGFFARHVARMRSLYRERQEALVESLRRRLGELITVQEAETGLHLVAWLRNNVDDAAVAKAAASVGVEAQPLSHYYVTKPGPPGLVLGFGAVPSSAMQAAADRLALAVEATRANAARLVRG